MREVGLAEDLTQAALVIALRRWPESGLLDKAGRLAHGHRPTSRDRPAGSNFEETIMTKNNATKTKAKPGQQKRFVTTGKASDESMGIDADQFVRKLKAHRSPVELKKYHRYFKFDEDQPGDGDKFMGVRMGQVFALAKEFIEMPPGEIEKLLESPVHEVRVGAVSIMDWQARSKKTPAGRRKALFDLYLRRHDRINMGAALCRRQRPPETVRLFG